MSEEKKNLTEEERKELKENLKKQIDEMVNMCSHDYLLEYAKENAITVYNTIINKSSFSELGFLFCLITC